MRIEIAPKSPAAMPQNRLLCSSKETSIEPQMDTSLLFVNNPANAVEGLWLSREVPFDVSFTIFWRSASTKSVVFRNAASY